MALTRSTLLVVWWWYGDPKMSEAPMAAFSEVQKSLVKRVAVRDEHVGQAHVAEDGADEVARDDLGGGLLDRRNQPHPPGEQVDVNLHEVLPGAGLGELDEVQADGAAPASRDGQREEQPRGRPVLSLDALTGGARRDEVGDVLGQP
eukprot:CAMPEP_0113676766 /NCGR_PEP_ID=MMETSP0038_2-20120614/8842_1 /TAXON_ID=2898 /ORGANISM="Cryptomonas paramecium" /LENGTH=146 /DNA_ID=CAMNT_0000593865 /DNA_START=591 /DNA_END=1027 /DNA_ORIENTATION=- /assembly_acc=CAM_ASM_000170